MQEWALTIHSSRSRFAARLNSGVRRHPVNKGFWMRKAFVIAGLLGAFAPIVVSASDAAATAQFLIRSDHPYDLWAFRTYKDGTNCKGLSPSMREADWIEINVNEPFTFFVTAASNSDVFNYKYCRVNATFAPDAGKRYFARFTFAEKTCGISVAEVSDANLSSPIPVDILLRAYKAPFLQSGSWCGKPIGK